MGESEKEVLWKTLRWILIIVVGGPIALLIFTLASGQPASNVLEWEYARGFLILGGAAAAMGIFVIGPTLVLGAIIRGIMSIFKKSDSQS